MNEPKSLIHHLVEAYDRYRAERRSKPDMQASSIQPHWPRHLARHMIPNIGTLVIVLALLWAQSAGALPLGRPQAAPEAASTGTIAYQGRLADASGTPLTGTYNMIFRLYDVATGGTPLWTEQWTGSNGVRVSDGLFNVMLGSLTTLPQSVIAGRNQLFLGITVGTDDEMAPRVQLGSVPFAVQALTVPDGSITSEKLNLANGLTVTGNLTVTNGINLGSVLNGPTSYWADYRSYIRILKDKGVSDATLCPEGGVPVGVVSPLQSLKLKTGNDIAQARYPASGTCVNVHQIAPCGSVIGDYYPYQAESCATDFSGKWAPFYWWSGQPTHDVTHNILGGGIGCFGMRYACVR